MKKKKVGAVILCIVLILGAFGLYAYQKQAQVEREMVYQVYRWILTEEYGEKNPLDLGVTVKELKKNPPKVQMNGRKGLYVSVIAYNYFAGNSIDYEDIRELMEQGKPLEVYEKYSDYLDWFTAPDTSGRYVTGYGINYRNDYAAAIEQVGAIHGMDISSETGSYQKYKEVLEKYPDEVEVRFESVKSE